MNQNNNHCTLYIVRHGETEWNVQNITQGQSNSVLTERGVEQAKEVASKLKDVQFDAIFSSDLVRTQKTAEIIKLDRGIAIQTSELLRERNFGTFEGKHASVFREVFKEKLAALENLSEEESWAFEFANDIETDEALAQRFAAKLKDIAQIYPGKVVLVVSHGGPIRMFLAKIGHLKKNELSVGSFQNGGYIKAHSDGTDFYIEEVKGVQGSQSGE